MKQKTAKAAHHVDVHVGKRIRYRRWMSGTAQQQLAEKVGIKFQQIQKYETGMNRVSASRLWDIAHALNVDVSFFFEGLEDAGIVEDAIACDKHFFKFAGELGRLAPCQRNKFFKLAAAFISVAQDG